jgi:hypothetical protein
MSTIAITRPLHRPLRNQAPIRLTRRGQAVVRGAMLASLLIIVMALTAAVGAGAWAGTEAGAPVETVSVMVAPGETLWSIASEFAGDRDIRAVIAEIRDLNSLSTGTIHAGQTLTIIAR